MVVYAIKDTDPPTKIWHYDQDKAIPSYCCFLPPSLIVDKLALPHQNMNGENYNIYKMYLWSLVRTVLNKARDLRVCLFVSSIKMRSKGMFACGIELNNI